MPNPQRKIIKLNSKPKIIAKSVPSQNDGRTAIPI